MATTLTNESLGPEIVLPPMRHVRISSPIGWSSIFVGTAVAAGSWLVLHLLGVGIGLTAIDPDNASSLEGVGIGTGIWSLIAPILALFIGGLVVGRTAPTVNTGNALIHAFAAWALTAIGTIMLLAMLLGAIGRAASSTAATVADVATSAGARADGVAPALGIDSDDLVARINKRLEERGMPKVTADQVTASVREVAQQMVRGETVSRESVTGIVARRTSLDRSQAEELADDIQREALRIKNRGRAMAADAGETALEVAEAGGKVLLGLSITMLLALGAALGGAAITVSRERREYTRTLGRSPADLSDVGR